MIAADWANSAHYLKQNPDFARNATKFLSKTAEGEGERAHLMQALTVMEVGTMESLLDWVAERYGGLDGYLDSIGFDSFAREKLRAAMRSDNVMAR